MCVCVCACVCVCVCACAGGEAEEGVSQEAVECGGGTLAFWHLASLFFQLASVPGIVSNMYILFVRDTYMPKRI